MQEICDRLLKKKESTFTPTMSGWNKDIRRKRNYIKALQRNSKLPTSTMQYEQKHKKDKAKYKKKILNAKRKAWTTLCHNTKDSYEKFKKTEFQDLYRQEVPALSQSTTVLHTRTYFHEDLTYFIFDPLSK